MLSYEPEVAWLRDQGVLKRDAADSLIARERRDVFSVHPETRLLAWIGVMLIATGAGIFIRNNLERIGPVAIATVIGVAALLCYAWVASRRGRGSLIDDYILLLGALLLSADVAYMERQFDLLGHGWPRHLLIMAVLHAVTAYWFASRTLLTLSLVALTGWLGVERNFGSKMEPLELAVRAFLAAAVVLTWRFANRHRPFDEVFHHFAANLALFGAVTITFADTIYLLGAIAAVAIAVFVIRFGFQQATEAYVIYGYIYAVVAVGIVIGRLINEPVLISFFTMVYMGAAIAGLFALHMRFRSVTS